MNNTVPSAAIIASVIAGQIGLQTLMCLGAHDKCALEGAGSMQGAFQFKFSNCRKIKSGFVTIALMHDDTYRVIILTSRCVQAYFAEGIHDDQLRGILQDNIGAY